MLKQLTQSALIASGAVLAMNVSAANYYVDLSYLKSTTDQTRGSLERSLISEGFDVRVTHFDNTEESLRPTLGYAFDNHHAIEVSYLNLGGLSTNLIGETFDSSGLFNALNRHQPKSAEGVTLSYRASLPLDENWTGSAELGVYRWESSGKIDSVPFEDSGTDFLWGLRLDYNLNQHWQLGLQATQITLPNHAAKLLSIGARYNF